MRILIVIVSYVVVETLIASWLATVFGWLAVLGLYCVGFVVGLLVMREASVKAAQTIRTAASSGAMPPNEMGDSGLLFLGGALLAVPGVATDVLGLLLVIPITRRWSRRPIVSLLGRQLTRQGISVVTTTDASGRPTSTIVPGDVIAGDVLDRHDATDDPDGGHRPRNGRGL